MEHNRATYTRKQGDTVLKRTGARGETGALTSAHPSPNDQRASLHTDSPTSLARLVTPAEARTLPVHRWFLYPHSYSPGLVRELLKAFDLRPGTTIYDPFAGAGTTLRTAQEEGYSASGVDMLPLSVLLSNAKVASYKVRDLERAWRTLQQRLGTPAAGERGLMSDIPLVAKAFTADIARTLAHIQASISVEPSARHRDFFSVALARLVEEVSLAVKSGGWPRLIERDIDPTSVCPSFIKLVDAMIEDVKTDRVDRGPEQWRCYRGDSTMTPHVRAYGAVITSPPYLNRHDYTRVLALEHAVLFGTQQTDIIALRRRLLRSHVEARRPQQARGYRMPTELAEVLPALKEATHTDRRVYAMITGYFEDMFLALRALRPRLADNGYVAFVLGDVRFAGIMVPVEMTICRLGEQVGLRWVATWQARERGNSAQQMKEHGREPAREYVIIWQAGRT